MTFNYTDDTVKCETYIDYCRILNKDIRLEIGYCGSNREQLWPQVHL